MSVLDREDWLSLTPKDILHIWKYEEESGKGRRIVLYPIDLARLNDAEAALQRGEQNVKISGSKITLNSTGALIWEMCDGSHTIEEIIESLVERFNVDREQVARDVRRFFEQLEPYHVLEIDWSPL